MLSAYRSPKPSARSKTIRRVPGTAGSESCVQNADRPVIHPLSAYAARSGLPPCLRYSWAQ